MTKIPTGTVTFLFTDIEGSTQFWERYPQWMRGAFARQEAILRASIAAHDGYPYKMIGDAFQVAFATAHQAVAAAIEAQHALSAEPWGEPGPLQVRMALHTGVTEERSDDYVGPELNRVARLLNAGYGGQILLTQTTYDLIRDSLPPGIGLIDLGEHQLKDLVRPEYVHQLTASGMPADFPPLKTSQAQTQAELPRERVAVLPFTNISADPADEYFADGMTEELISSVSKTKGLRVIARTSVMRYKATGKSIAEIGRELNVGSVLEGSVRKSGDKIRVTVQFVETSNEEPRWSQDYDREISDVFAIQSDIAQRVAEALREQVLGGTSVVEEDRATNSTGSVHQLFARQAALEQEDRGRSQERNRVLRRRT